MRTDPPTPHLSFTMELHVKLGAPMEIGAGPHGRRRIIPIEGGTFEGPGLRGTVLPGGADWQIIRPDGLSELDTRYALRTDDGALIYIQNAGMRHAAPEIVEAGRTGLLVPPDDPNALAEAVGSLLDEPERGQAFGAAAVERARSEFSVARMADRTLEVYDRALRRS